MRDVLLLVAVASALPSAQQATFRADTSLVAEVVTVLDARGNPLEGLTAADFVVTENGVRQTVAFAEFQRLNTHVAPVPGPTPQNRPLTSAQATSTLSSRPGEIQYGDHRLLIFYFDLSALPLADRGRAFWSADRYIGASMGASDLVAVITFDGGAVRVKQHFTDDRERLQAVLRLLMYGEDQDGDGVPDQADFGSAFGQNDGEFNLLNTDRQLAALQTAVTLFQRLPEQKALLYFASGLRLRGPDNQAQLRATINAALRSNVTINPIDARGLTAEPPMGDARTPSPGGLDIFTGEVAGRSVARQQASHDTLYSLAKDTGGTALFDNNDLSESISQTAGRLTSYYIVGYYTSTAAKDGKFRRVDVSVPSRPSAHLSYRAGYFAEKEYVRFSAADKERQLEEALLQGDPITDIPIAAEVNYFQISRAEYFVPVSARIPASELTSARRRGANRADIDVVGEVKDDYGVTIQNMRDRIEIPLTPDRLAEFGSRPIQYETGFTLLPGRYVLKLLVRDAVTGRIGTYQRDFVVPNLNRVIDQVPLSTVVLGAQAVPVTDALFTVRQKISAVVADPLVSDGQKLLPSVTRVFSARRDLHVYLQAYRNAVSSHGPLVAFVTLFREDIKALESDLVRMGASEQTAIPLRFTLPLITLTPGDYECQVTVLDLGNQRASFWRAPIVVTR